MIFVIVSARNRLIRELTVETTLAKLSQDSGVVYHKCHHK